MLKKLLILSLMLVLVNIFALDIYGLYELTGDLTLNEDLHIYPGGTLQPYNTNPTLTVNGNIINEGTIQNHLGIGYQLYINCSGNINNTGSITNNKITLNGSGAQVLHTTSGTPISSSYFDVTNTTLITPSSDIYFSNSQVYFPNGGGFDLSDGFGLILDGGFLNNGNVTGSFPQFPQPYLQLMNSAYIGNSTCTDLFLWETILVEENVIFSGSYDNKGTISPRVNAHRTLTVNDNFTNSGTISNNGLYLLTVNSSDTFTNEGIVNCRNFNISGSLTNNGTLSPMYMTFNGTGAQDVYCLNSTALTPYKLYCSNTSGITAQTDLYLTSVETEFSGYQIDLSAGYNLYVNGGYLYQSRITGDASDTNTSIMDMTNDSYISTSEVSDMTLSGYFNADYNAVTLSGKIINQGIVQNRSNYFAYLLVNGEFTNNGTVKNNTAGYNLTINAAGTVINNGLWSNSYLYFSGTAVQNISCLNGNGFNSQYTSCTNTNGILAKSDLYFSDSYINFTDYSLDLSEGYDIFISGGYLNRTNVTGSTDSETPSYFNMSNGSYMQNTILNNLTLSGEINIVDDANIFSGNIINTGILQNYPWYFYSLTINGNFSNEGTVKNHTDGYNLTINAKADITNDGTWNNIRTNFNGDVNQHITILNGNGIASNETYFTTSITNGPFQWFYNHNPILEPDPDFSGEAGQQLRWLVPVNLTYAGTFYCETGDGRSKWIYVNDGTFSIPNITSFSNNGTDVSIQWDSIPSAVYYRVFSSDDPYQDPNDSSWFVEAENVMTNSWTAPAPVGNKKFYYISAVY